jgi:hypothetical protein
MNAREQRQRCPERERALLCRRPDLERPRHGDRSGPIRVDKAAGARGVDAGGVDVAVVQQERRRHGCKTGMQWNDIF